MNQDSFIEQLNADVLKQQLMWLTIRLEVIENYYQGLREIDTHLIDNLHRRLLKLEGYE